MGRRLLAGVKTKRFACGTSTPLSASRRCKGILIGYALWPSALMRGRLLVVVKTRLSAYGMWEIRAQAIASRFSKDMPTGSGGLRLLPMGVHLPAAATMERSNCGIYTQLNA